MDIRTMANGSTISRMAKESRLVLMDTVTPVNLCWEGNSGMEHTNGQTDLSIEGNSMIIYRTVQSLLFRKWPNGVSQRM